MAPTRPIFRRFNALSTRRLGPLRALCLVAAPRPLRCAADQFARVRGRGFMGEPCARVRDLSTGRSSSVLCSKGARDLSNLQCHCGCIVVVAAGQVRNQRWSKDNLVSFEISADCAQVKRRDLKSGKGFDALQ